MVKAPAGALVSLHYDTDELVEPGHVIETQSGRRYGVVGARVQTCGKHAGRQHLKCLVLGSDDELAPGVKVHPIFWYRRQRRQQG